jgi:adenylosuccinate synthase
MLQQFCQPGKADCVLGLQFGSEGKGAAIAWLIHTLKAQHKRYDIVTTNASSQAGHTAIVDGKTYVTRHLPTAPLVAQGSTVYLSAGAAIDPDVIEQELKDYDYFNLCDGFFIHPNAIVITPECIEAEQREDSAQTRISSTRKGVGEAIAARVTRQGVIARDHPYLKQFVRRLDLNTRLHIGKSVLVEIPQGYGLSLSGKFYPYCTSRDCTVMQAFSDAHIHPSFIGATLGVCRTFPIRVGSLPGHSSGDCYPDQRETTWAAVGVKPEITTVTKRERRVFTWSQAQITDAMLANRPNVIYLSFCDYVKPSVLSGYIVSLWTASSGARVEKPAIFCAFGPRINDVSSWDEIQLAPTGAVL